MHTKFFPVPEEQCSEISEDMFENYLLIRDRN